ncbi:MAG: hypothetical protein M3N35_01695 [Candidatus Binatota bacterium]|nr:hypothetical protein [Candidatus Binatota bacterium]
MPKCIGSMLKLRGSRNGKKEIVLSDKTARLAAGLDYCRREAMRFWI